MAHYSLERRESVVRRMLNEGMSMSVLARETGIAEGTLYRWREAAKTNGEVVSKSKPHEKMSAAQKVAMVAETAAFNAAELGEHCRAKGLYPEQVRAGQHGLRAGDGRQHGAGEATARGEGH